MRIKISPLCWLSTKIKTIDWNKYMQKLRYRQARLYKEMHYYTFLIDKTMKFIAEPVLYKGNHVRLKLNDGTTYWFHMNDIYFEDMKQKKFKYRRERIFIKREDLEAKGINIYSTLDRLDRFLFEVGT